MTRSADAHRHGDPMTLLLLHGLGGNAGVWTGATDLLPGGRTEPGDDVTGLAGPGWLAVDLPGHGYAASLSAYTYPACAEAVSAAVPADTEIDVLGHSFGGVVGLALAGLRPVRSVVTVGMRVVWPAAFVATLAGLAAKPPRAFAGRAEAAAFLLRINGLGGWLAEDSEFVRRGLHREPDGQWWPTHDPRALGVGEPPFDDLLAAASAAGTSVTLAHGVDDTMVAVGDYDGLAARHGATSVVLPGLGHNAHVEDPSAVLDLLAPGVRPA